MKINLNFKYTLLSVMLIVVAFASNAQNDSIVRKGYSGNAEFIVGIMELGLNTTQGYRFNKHWSVGGNTGVNISWCGPVIPICAVAQFDFLSGHKSSLFVNAKAGTIFAPANDSKLKEQHVGGNFAVGVGVRYKRMSYQLAYNLVLLKNYIHDTQELAPGYATIQLRIGYNFGKR